MRGWPVMRAGSEVVSEELRRYIAVLEICAAGFEDTAATIAGMAEGNPYGAMLRHVPQIYREQHAEQVRLTDHIVHNLHLLSARLRVAAEAYAQGTPEAAERAVCDGDGVPKPRQRQTSVPVPEDTDVDVSLIAAPPPPGEPWATLLSDPVWLIGSAEAVAAIVTTWNEVADSMHQLTDRLESALNGLDSWSGTAAGEHLRLIRHNIGGMRGLANISQAMAHGMNACVAVTALAGQWLEFARHHYTAAWDGADHPVDLGELVDRNLAFTALAVAILTRLYQTMKG